MLVADSRSEAFDGARANWMSTGSMPRESRDANVGETVAVLCWAWISAGTPLVASPSRWLSLGLEATPRHRPCSGSTSGENSRCEQNAVLGRANRMAPRASRIATAFETVRLRAADRDKTTWTGNPFVQKLLPFASGLCRTGKRQRFERGGTGRQPRRGYSARLFHSARGLSAEDSGQAHRCATMPRRRGGAARKIFEAGIKAKFPRSSTIFRRVWHRRFF